MRLGQENTEESQANQLIDELWLRILQFLDIGSLATTGLVSKKFHGFSLDQELLSNWREAYITYILKNMSKQILDPLYIQYCLSRMSEFHQEKRKLSFFYRSTDSYFPADKIANTLLSAAKSVAYYEKGKVEINNLNELATMFKEIVGEDSTESFNAYFNNEFRNKFPSAVELRKYYNPNNIGSIKDFFDTIFALLRDGSMSDALPWTKNIETFRKINAIENNNFRWKMVVQLLCVGIFLVALFLLIFTSIAGKDALSENASALLIFASSFLGVFALAGTLGAPRLLNCCLSKAPIIVGQSEDDLETGSSSSSIQETLLELSKKDEEGKEKEKEEPEGEVESSVYSAINDDEGKGNSIREGLRFTALPPPPSEGTHLLHAVLPPAPKRCAIM
jgi:hypothetical protein